jgi:hypothetical protein
LRRGPAASCATHLALEPLEQRLVLTVDPVLTFIPDQIANEGTQLDISATFTDVVEGDGVGGSTIGFNPNDYVSLGSFDPLSNVVIDTDALTVSGIGGTGVVETADIGFGTFEIAVFAFSDFELDAGITLTATGSRPLALLSQGNMTIAGTIDISARFDPGLSGNQVNGELLAGAGGGNGGLGGNAGAGDPPPVTTLPGDPAAGAPADSVGKPRVNAPFVDGGGGGGAGFGGFGGNAEGPGGATGGDRNSYGDLSIAIQGGSGGGTAGGGSPTILASGGGGGGGIEFGAVGTLTIASGAQVLADGGDAGDAAGFPAGFGGGGGGAGGGILLHATSVNQFGLLRANGGAGGTAPRDGGGGGGGRIMIVYSSSGTFDNTGGIQSALGGATTGVAPAQPGFVGTVDIMQEAPAATPVFELFDFVIDWGDTPPAVDSGMATVDVPGVNIGDPVAGSFAGSHTYGQDGIYFVTVTINDDHGGSAMQMFMVTVSNLDPTITVDNAAVTVNEGDTAANGGTFADVPADVVTLSASLGTVVDAGGGNWTWSYDSTDDLGPVSVTITAEDEDGGMASVMFDLTVNNVAPTADAGGPYTTFIDEPITLTGSGTDVPADVLSFEWFLGGVGGTLFSTDANATFDPVALGITTTTAAMVTLRVTDDDGDSATATATVSVIGPGSTLIDGTLYIIGTDQKDFVAITKHSSNIKVVATFNSSNPLLFNIADVSEIEVRVRGGNDVVVIANSVTVPTTVDGGSGNDVLTAGGGDTVIYGGSGNDVLAGGPGDNVLIGGDGSDVIVGGAGRDLIVGGDDSDILIGGGGDDILIGGWTIYDENIAPNRAAIDAIMAVWTSSASFSARVATLTGSGGLLQANAAVFDDDDCDLLLGGGGHDLLFADTNLWDGAIDLVAFNWFQDALVPVN